MTKVRPSARSAPLWRSGTLSLTSIGMTILLLIMVAQVLRSGSSVQEVDVFKELDGLLDAKGTSAGSGSNDAAVLLPSKKLCPKTASLFSPQNDLVAMIQSKIDYYGNGGGLSVMTKYLDNQIDRTLAIGNATFLPNQNNYKHLSQETTAEYIGPNRKSTKPRAIKTEETVDDVSGYVRAFTEKHKNRRGGYGQPLMGKFEGHNKDFLSDDRRVEGVFEMPTKEKWLVAMGQQYGPMCQHFTTLGESYAAKKYCVSDTSDTSSNDAVAASADGGCHFVSVGSNDQWEFEQDTLKTMPHCHIHVFDCTLSTPDGLPQKMPKSDMIHFYKYCMGPTDHSDLDAKREYRSYQSMLDIAGIPNVKPSYLKMDIEGFEIEIIPSMIQRIDPQKLPEQIMIEVHTASKMVALSWLLRILSVGELYNWFSVMFLAGGYIPITADWFWREPRVCMEVLFVQVLCPA